MNVEFKLGDTVKSPEIWGDKMRFNVIGFMNGGRYRIVICQMCGKPETNSNKCNIIERDLVLVDAIKRPFRNIAYKQLEVLLKRGISEAIREIEIRK